MRYRLHCLSLWMFAVIFVSSCDGGLMGTGTGPGRGNGSDVVKGEVPRLPKKISPLLPRSITGTALANLASEDQVRSIKAMQQDDSSQSAARSWSLLQPSMQEIETSRIAVQEMLALLDREFDSIQNACEYSLLETGECLIEAGEIVSFYDDTVTQQMVAIYKTARADTPSADIIEDADTSKIRSYYTTLEGSAVEFNQIAIQYSKSGGHTFRLTTSSNHLLEGRELRLDWNSTYDQITYDLVDLLSTGQETQYNYRINSSGQQLTVQRSSNGAVDPQSFSVEFTTQFEDTGEVYYNARVDEYYVSGQATENTAYAYAKDFDASEGSYLQELFDESGSVIATQVCFLEGGRECDKDVIAEEFVDYYLSEAEYDDVIDGLGFDDIEVLNLPADVFQFLVVENDPELPLSLREVYCDGWQPERGDIELFCLVYDFELEDTVVVSVDGKEPGVIPGARLVIEDD